jgi:Carboxypeptidase regulatory-like domain
MIFWFRLSLLVQVLMTAQAAPQMVPPAQRPDSVAPESRSATIRGKITNAKTGDALKDAQVTMGLVGQGEAVAAGSDATGYYEIRVAPGQYYLSVAKDGFVRTQYLDVANLPSLQLAAGQDATVDLRMVPGATIEGTVIDLSGAPIPDADIQATMKIWRQGKVEWQLRATARTLTENTDSPISPPDVITCKPEKGASQAQSSGRLLRSSTPGYRASRMRKP